MFGILPQISISRTSDRVISQTYMEMLQIEPETFGIQRRCSTTKLHPFPDIKTTFSSSCTRVLVINYFMFTLKLVLYLNF